MNFIAKKFYSKFQNSILSDKPTENFQSIGNDKINQLMKYIERSHWPRVNNFTSLNSTYDPIFKMLRFIRVGLTILLTS